MAQRFANAARGILASAITSGTTTIEILEGGDLFPVISGNDWFKAVLQDEAGIEIIRVNARTGNVFTVVRGQEGTTARAFSVGTTVGLRITAADVEGSIATANNSVQLTGNQTIAGTKTFTSPIVASGGTITGTLIFGSAASSNTQTIQFGDNTGWALRYMTSVLGTPTERFRFMDHGHFTATGNITAGGQFIGNVTGNAATATALQTARTINGVSFNGSANITLPTVNTTGDQTIGGIKTFTSNLTVGGSTSLNGLIVNSYTLGLSNAQAVAGQRCLLTIAASSPIYGRVTIYTGRPAADSGAATVMASFRFMRSGAVTGAGALFYAYQTDGQSAFGTNFSSWFFDTTTGVANLRFGQTGNSYTYFVVVESNVASSNFTLAVDGGTVPSGTTVANMASFEAIFGGGLSLRTNDVDRLQIDSSGNVNVLTGALRQAGNQVLHAGNFTTFSPSLTGSGASGTWGINVTGNAGTVTNGVYTTGDQTIGGVKTFTSNVGIGTSSPQANLEVSAPLGSNGPTLRLSSTGLSANAGQQIGALDFFNSDADIPGVAAYVRALAGPSAGVGGQLIFGTQETWNTGVLRERLRIDSSGNVLVTSNTGGLGYGTGAGGTVTQATSKSTAVTLNRPTGRITLNNEALGAGASVVFRVNNSLVSSSDCVLVQPSNAATQAYTCQVVTTSTGIFDIRVTNFAGGPLSEALVINFAIIKGATS